MAGLTEVVRSLMSARDVSVRGLAGQVGYDQGGLSKIIAGRRRCPPNLARLLDDALGADGAVIIAAAAAPEPPVDAEHVRRALEDALADGIMSDGLLSEWEVSTVRYGYRTRDTPSSPLLVDIAADLAELRLAICRHRSASALPRLTRTAAHMSGLICLTLIKVGDGQSWRRWGRTARHAATESADLSALAWATAQEAYGYYYAGDMPGAVACSRSALGVSSSPSVGAVLAAALEMRAHAVMGDTLATMTALRTAQEIHGRLSGPDLAASAFGYAESQFRFHLGDALTRLGDTTAALVELDRALELCGPEDYTDWAMIRLDRAACVARDGDVETALGYAKETLLSLEAPKRQGIISGHSRELLTGLTPAQRSSQAARDFRALLVDTVGMKGLPA